MTTGGPRIGIVLGTRPEIIKNWSIVQALRRREVPHHVLHTNQHTALLMDGAVFSELEYAPDQRYEGIYSLGRAIDWVRACISELELELIVVNGDTAASLVGALGAVYSDVGVAHVEAGLRSYDREMYEERNRIMVDAAAHYLFTYTEQEADFLRQRPELRGRVFNAGNTTVDVIDAFASRLERPRPGRYAYVTLHRKELTDRPDVLVEVFGALAELAREVNEVVFPVHPRTRDVMERHRIPPSVLGDVVTTEPVGALASLAHVKHAAVVVTDSGCVQEEACILGVPCVTVRENTERGATLAIGANVLSGLKRNNILACARYQIARTDRDWPAIYGSPGAGERIVDVLQREFRSFRDY